MAQDLWTLREVKQKSQPVHGPPMQSRVAAANRAVLAACARILAHMAMNKGGGVEMQNRTGAKMDEGSRHGITRPLQANTAGRRSDRHRPCSKQLAADEVGQPLP